MELHIIAGPNGADRMNFPGHSWLYVSKPSKNVLRLPIEKRAEIALKVAVAKAIDEHTRLGLPVYVWRNGRVVRLSPADARDFSKRRR